MIQQKTFRDGRGGAVPGVPSPSVGLPFPPEPRLPAPPPAAVRGERLLARVDQAFAWLDGWFARWLPAELNPLAQSGKAANFSLLVAVASGVLLLLWYSPSVATAYTSLQALQTGGLGGWVRALHRYSSDLVMLLLVVHAGRMAVARKFAGARWLAWVSGVALLTLIWFIGWTGYWLVWDQPAQQVAVMSIHLLDAFPIFGEPLGRLFLADRLVPSLLFFVVFFLHMLLPLMIAVGLAVHLFRLSRVKLLPDWRLGLALTVGLASASWLIPAPLDAPAAMAVNATHFTVDAWYLAPLALGLRLQGAGLWLALLASIAVVMALPWLLGRRRPPVSFQAEVEISRCHACTQCVQDCPFDAITMVTRTDGKRFPSQAWVDPARCVGCGVCAGSCDSEGIALPWFDTRREEARIEQEVATLRREGGGDWVAFVAADIDSGLALFALARWRQRLPGFQVHPVPTASWVRPKLVERLLQSGVRGVLVLRDARAEAAARDGNRWVALRLAGQREPVFRPQRASCDGRWQVLDYDPSRPEAAAAAADAFRHGANGPRPRRQATRIATGVAAALILAAGVTAAVVAPSHLRVTSPLPPDPEFIFSFKAYGEMVAAETVDPAADADKPVHMRGRATAKPQRAPVVVRVTIDGVTEEHAYRAKGISRDGPALDQVRQTLAAGVHAVAVEIQTGPETPPVRWNASLEAEPRHRHVLSYDAEHGFVLEE